MKRRYRFLFFAIGVAGVALLIYKARPEKAQWQELLKPEILLLMTGLFLLWGIIYAIHTGVYRIILAPEEKKINFWQLYKICVTGFALNSVTPAGLVGGEPYRIMELKRYYSSEKAVSSTLTFTLLYVMGHVLLWVTGVIIYLCFGCPGEVVETVLLCVAGAALALVTALVVFGRKKGFAVPTLRFLSHIPLVRRWASKKLETEGAHFEEIDAGYVAFRQEKGRFWKGLAMEYLSRVLEGAEYFVILYFLEERVNLLDGILIMSTASLLGNLLFIIPMQAGTREGGMAIALRWVGIDPGTGLMAGLIYRVRDIACIIIGVLCLLIDRELLKKSAAAREDAS